MEAVMCQFSRTDECTIATAMLRRFEDEGACSAMAFADGMKEKFPGGVERIEELKEMFANNNGVTLQQMIRKLWVDNG